MDRFNYDQDRISSCCHHLLDTQGNAVSFCEYNALLRPTESWDQFPKLYPQRRKGRGGALGLGARLRVLCASAVTEFEFGIRPS